MRAWQYNKYGGGATSLEQVEIPVPKAGKNQILLKIHASSVNPVDWKLQTGFAKLVIRLTLPITPGLDMAGTVAAVGSGVTHLSVGDRVAVQTNMTKQGALAEYAAVDTKAAIAKLPPEVSFEQAAGLPVAARTVLQGLTKAGAFPKSNGRVLVLGGSGGVGHYAVQVAKAAGAHVTATAGARNFDLLKSLGADEVLD
ncbi:Oxidoreductase [Klebsormidium nitens]|uniref:Oxidoreductase n=1 Tax=Klebsormidium nitens TaxID=105231 RepID=A0A1Y1IDE8_KLENI|nr:Oxidoreductase [Klebsormidium nitens]|eukprot:GAQ88613.1 Oxidoreductase [Klebsormidium nitens]